MKSHTFLRVCAALGILCLFTILSACSEGASETLVTVNEQTTAPLDTPAVETELTRANYPDTLPADLDFEGAEYRILCRNSTELSTYSTADEMVTEELTGEVINDAIYNRALVVMNRLNVTIDKAISDDVNATIRADAAAGDSPYDVVAGYAYYITPLALEGLFVDWLDIPHLNLEQPWWPSSLSDDLIINNSLYFISGDISMQLLQFTYCMYFNKTIAEDWNVPDLYELVLDGKWTLDQYTAIASLVSADLNGDGRMNNDDLYGTLNNHYCDVTFACFGLPLSSKNDDGTLELAVMSEKFVDVYTRLYDFYWNSDCVIRHTDKAVSTKLFMEDHLLFYPYLIFGSESMREMTSDYGIIPYPKYDEAQENYATSAHDNYSLMCIPVQVATDKYEMIGAVTEAMAAESYRTVTPAYYEVALKSKYLRDENSAAMLDIISSNVKFDPAAVYSNSLGDVGHLMRGVYDNQQNIVSYYEKMERVYQKAFEKFNDKYLSLQ